MKHFRLNQRQNFKYKPRNIVIESTLVYIFLLTSSKENIALIIIDLHANDALSDVHYNACE